MVLYQEPDADAWIENDAQAAGFVSAKMKGPTPYLIARLYNVFYIPMPFHSGGDKRTKNDSG